MRPVLRSTTGVRLPRCVRPGIPNNLQRAPCASTVGAAFQDHVDVAGVASAESPAFRESEQRSLGGHHNSWNAERVIPLRAAAVDGDPLMQTAQTIAAFYPVQSFTVDPGQSERHVSPHILRQPGIVQGGQERVDRHRCAAAGKTCQRPRAARRTEGDGSAKRAVSRAIAASCTGSSGPKVSATCPTSA